MRILHVTLGIPPLRSGGLVKYCMDLANHQIKAGENVEILFPAYFTLKRQTSIKTHLAGKLVIHKIINPLPVPLIYGINSPKRYMKTCNSDCYLDLLSNNIYDIIHVHSFMGVHKEFFDLAAEKKIPIIFTTHDYFPLCIKTSFFDYKNEFCQEYDDQKCAECNFGEGLNKKLEYLVQSNIYSTLKSNVVVKKIRSLISKSLKKSPSKTSDNLKLKTNEYSDLSKYYKLILENITAIHSNSYLAKSIYERELPDKTNHFIPITHSDMESGKSHDKKEKTLGDIVKLGYFGGNNEKKGFNFLVRALNQKGIKNGKKLELFLWGDDYPRVDIDSVEVYNKGFYKYKDLNSVLNEIDILIVPSLWPETFGFIVAEALLRGVPVICSNNVGASYLLDDCSPNLVYKYNDENEFIKKLNYALLDENYKRIREMIVLKSFDFDMNNHTESISVFYRIIISTFKEEKGLK